MKKKLMKYILSIVLVSLILVTAVFLIIVNYEYEGSIKSELKSNNRLIINALNSDNIKNRNLFFESCYKNSGIRVTYIDINGHVIADTMADAETLNNHNSRIEVKEARKNKTGYSIRYSNTLHKNMMYFATEFDNGYIIRSSMPMDTLRGFEEGYIYYYLASLIIVILISVITIQSLSKKLVKPIIELKDITSHISNGEFNKRVKIKSEDEIGELGKTFNNMADKLEETLNDLIDKQNRLEAILKSMDSGVIAIDENNKVLMINPYAEKIFGLSKNIIGLNLLDNIRDFELENVFKNNSDGYSEIKILWPAEKELRIRTADIVNANEHIGTVAVIQDITDIKKLENMRSQFVANVSHELKTPLTSIKGFAETIKYVKDPEKREKFLNIINEEAERLTRLINDILTLSDIESNTDFVNEEVDVNSSIMDVYNLMKDSAESKGIKLSADVNQPVIIYGSKDRFKQMLINLVDNAIKYSETGASVSIRQEIKEGVCKIYVEDTGVGIPKEHIPRLFERFYRVDKARSRAKGGTGLGLAIVKHIVISFNGTIEVKSELGKGSSFIITLPFKRVD